MRWLQGPRPSLPLESGPVEIVAPVERAMLERAEPVADEPLADEPAEQLPDLGAAEEACVSEERAQAVLSAPDALDAGEVEAPVERWARIAPSDPTPDRFDGERFAQSLRMLEERLLAVQDELREERLAVRAMEAELAAERERMETVERSRDLERQRADAAEGERARSQEETQAYRRVLAAAVANEKYALDHAAQSKREVQARGRALEEAARSRGAAEGRAQELEKRVEELSSPRPLGRSSFARAAALLAVALLLGGVALAEWGAAWRSIASEPRADVVSPSAGLHMALGTGAFALAALLWLLWEREVRRFEEGNGRRARGEPGKS